MKSAPLTIALGALALLVLRWTTGCAATSTSDVDLESGSRDNPIVNGQETADYPATGMLLQQGQPFCTGTVVGPRTVVTAAHCVENQDPSQISFGFGPSAGQIEAELKVALAVTHPEWDSQQLANDIAVITLGEDAPVEPIPLNKSMDDSWIGRKVTLVGYGVSDGPSQTGAGIKREVTVTIDQLEPTTLHYTTTNGQTACNGDSGGPAYADEGGELVIAGITSYGDQNCKEYGVYTRVDAFLGFVEEQIAAAGSGPSDPSDPGVDPNDPGVDPNDPGVDPNDPGVDPNDPGVDPSDPGAGAGCNGETWEGRCEGDMVIWCENDQVYGEECLMCGWIDSEGYYGCLL